MIHKLIPWLVAVVVCCWLGAAFCLYATWFPVRWIDIWLMIVMTCSGAVVIRGYFRIYAIFDRMDKRL